jgi:hypothetical protein
VGKIQNSLAKSTRLIWEHAGTLGSGRTTALAMRQMKVRNKPMCIRILRLASISSKELELFWDGQKFIKGN